MSRAAEPPKRSVSPSNKLLVKRVLNYYELLENLRKHEGYRDLKRNGSLSRTPSPNTSVPPKEEPYVDSQFRDKKISELKPILEKELVQARKTKIFEPSPQQASKAYSGYPSFTHRRETKSTKKPDSKPSSASKSPLNRASEILGSPVKDFSPKDTVFECGLLPLDTRNRLFPAIGDVMRKRHQIHQDRSKEIRRLQYQASLDTEKPLSSAKKPKPASKPAQKQVSKPQNQRIPPTNSNNDGNLNKDIKQLIKELEDRVNERMKTDDSGKKASKDLFERVSGEDDPRIEAFETVAADDGEGDEQAVVVREVARREPPVLVSKDVLRYQRVNERVPVQSTPHLLATIDQVYLRSQKLEANMAEDESDRSFSSGPDIFDDADPLAKDFDQRGFQEGPENSHSEGSDMGLEQEAQPSSEEEDDVGHVFQEPQRYTRTLPDETFSVFRPTSTESKPQGVYGEISCPDGFLVDLFESKLLIKNNDRVWLRVYDPPKAVHGKVKRYKPGVDYACDFVVLEDQTKARIPLIVDNSSLVNTRFDQAAEIQNEGTRVLTKPTKSTDWGQECTVVSPSSNQTYPGAIFSLDSTWVPRSSTSSLKLSSNPIDNGVLLDSNNTVSRCLIRWLSPSTLSLKTTKHGLRRMSVLKSSELLLEGVSVTAYTLDDGESQPNSAKPGQNNRNANIVHEIVVCVDESYKIVPDLLIGSEKASLTIPGYSETDESVFVRGTVVLQPGLRDETPRVFLLSKETQRPTYFEILGLDARQTLKKLFKISQVLKKMVGYKSPDVSSPELSAKMQPKSPKSVRFSP